MFWNILKYFFFKIDPEKAHYLSMDLLNLVSKIPIVSKLFFKTFELEHNSLRKQLFGLQFRNTLGLAAGFDKDGKWLQLLDKLGFGFVEVGTVTPIAQQGNDKPRLFRLKKDEAIINRMGFNNAGVDALVSRLSAFRKTNSKLIIGGNIGKNKLSEGDQILKDYLICFEKLVNYVDYFVVNVSSPNTPNLRSLQEKKPLDELLYAIQQANSNFNKPIFLKIAPDLSSSALDDIIEVVLKNRLTGIIATNTTISRPDNLISDAELKSQTGGLSGLPLFEKSNEVLAYIKSKISESNLILIGVGGIHTEFSAIEKFNHGADLIQIYSGMIYRGPWFCKHIKNSILKEKN